MGVDDPQQHISYTHAVDIALQRRHSFTRVRTFVNGPVKKCVFACFDLVFLQNTFSTGVYVMSSAAPDNKCGRGHIIGFCMSSDQRTATHSSIYIQVNLGVMIETRRRSNFPISIYLCLNKAGTWIYEMPSWRKMIALFLCTHLEQKAILSIFSVI